MGFGHRVYRARGSPGAGAAPHGQRARRPALRGRRGAGGRRPWPSCASGAPTGSSRPTSSSGPRSSWTSPRFRRTCSPPCSPAPGSAGWSAHILRAEAHRPTRPPVRPLHRRGPARTSGGPGLAGLDAGPLRRCAAPRSASACTTRTRTEPACPTRRTTTSRTTEGHPGEHRRRPNHHHDPRRRCCPRTAASAAAPPRSASSRWTACAVAATSILGTSHRQATVRSQVGARALLGWRRCSRCPTATR